MQIGTKFVCEQIEASFLVYPWYARSALVLQQVLEKASKQNAPLAIIQTRPKSIPSFAEKDIRKKKTGHYIDPLMRTTDLCGGRIITQTLTEVQAECTFSLHARKAGGARLGGAGTTRPALYGYEALSNPTQASGRDGPDAHWESMNGGKDKECLYLFPVKK